MFGWSRRASRTTVMPWCSGHVHIGDQEIERLRREMDERVH
jgi:hypothetical protein